MADISSITLPNGNSYDFKDANGRKTQNLVRPSGMQGISDPTLQTLINSVRANRLAFLPADQIIIENTIDGGTTWTDAGVSDATKVGLFSETRNSISLPKINNEINLLCGTRVTITGMKYNVPSGTAETSKYNYWNSSYINKTERYCQLKEMYFWVSVANNSMSVKVERATGANPNYWYVIFNDSSYYMTGWSGCDYISFNQGVFGGGTTQTGNYWNYRITFMTRGKNGTDTLNTGYLTSSMSVMEIRAYGDTYWTKGNEYMATDKIYSHDPDQNVTFPANVTANNFYGYLSGGSLYSHRDILGAAGKYQAASTIYRYMVLLTADENKLLPVSTASNNTGTSKTLTSSSFDPFGQIYYYNITTTVQSGSTVSSSNLFSKYEIDLRYSFNTGTSLTSNKSVYIVADPQTDGSAKLASSPISQDLPTTADGHIYIRLGVAYSNYQVQLETVKPVYYYSNGAIRLWTNAPAPACTCTDANSDGNVVMTFTS